MIARYPSARLAQLAAALVAVLAAASACGGPSFEASTFRDAGDSSTDDAGSDVDNTPIIVVCPCDPDATVDAGLGAADATTEGGGNGDAAFAEVSVASSDSPGESTSPDTTSLDAASRADANACTAGGSCSPNDCQSGTLACIDGGRICQETAPVAAGTPCGAASADGGAHVCSGGQCVACNAGGDCSDSTTPCIKKGYDCSTGSPQCNVTGNVADGVTCGAGLYCNGGICSACRVSASCPPAGNPCHVGKVTACSSGVATCSNQGSLSSAGTSCPVTGGASGVCDGNGNCVACSTGSQCSPNGGLCQVGVQSCSAGAQCTNPANVREGQTCATNQICHGGSCVPCDDASCSSGCCDSHGCVITAQSTTECGTGLGGGTCMACSGPSGGTGTPTCSGNACGLSCGGSTPNLCGLACVDLQSDGMNCGSCASACTGGTTCQSGTCGCASGQASCGGTCVAIISDPKNCGSCGHDCLGGSCSLSACQPSVIATMALSGPLFLDANALYSENGVSPGTPGALVVQINKAGSLIGAAGSNVANLFAQDATSIYLVYLAGTPNWTITRVLKSPFGSQSNLLTDGDVADHFNNVAVAGSQAYYIVNEQDYVSAGRPNLYLSSVAASIDAGVDTHLDTSNGATLAGDTGGIVWAQSTGALVAADPSFTTRTALITPASPSPGAIVLDAANAYWYNGTDQKIYRSARDGSSVNPLVSSPLAHAPGQLAVDTNFVYWADGTAGSISRVPIGSSAAAATTLATGQTGAGGIAVDPATGPPAALYWSTGSALVKLAK